MKDVLDDKGATNLKKAGAGSKTSAAQPADNAFSSLKITLSERQLNQLKEMAERFGISVEELIQANIEEMLIPRDASFDEATEYLLAKNAALYRRLA